MSSRKIELNKLPEKWAESAGVFDGSLLMGYTRFLALSNCRNPLCGCCEVAVGGVVGEGKRG